MPNVFISYRRDDTAGEARALFNALVERLGERAVFMDVDNIALGRDFRKVLQERLESCDLLLALVGRDWISATNGEGQRRLDDPNDFVRFEIEAALKRNIVVAPVLVRGARMPSTEELPASIRDLAYRHGFELSHARWESDVQEMLKRLEIGPASGRTTPAPGAGLRKELANYLPNLISLVTRPKTAILRWTDSPKNDLAGPLVFVTISVALGFLLQLPRVGKEHSFLMLATSMAVFKVLALGLMAALIHLFFLAVRGRAGFSSTFSAYLYISSPLYLALVVLETTSHGVLRVYDPALAEAARLNPGQLMANQEQMRIFQATAPGLALSFELLNSASVLVMLGWFTACWGAFRALHSVSRWRSTLAGIGSLVAGAFFFQGMNYVVIGMFGSFAPPLR